MKEEGFSETIPPGKRQLFGCNYGREDKGGLGLE